MIKPATAAVKTVVILRLTKPPIISLREVNNRSGNNANGMAKLSMTWLITSVRVGSRPSAITTSGGNMVTSRRIQIGI